MYDDSGLFERYGQLARSQHGLEAAKEWPAVRALIGDVAGLDVLDLGCGYGWFGRWAHRHGARRVVGIDASVSMLDQAAELTSDQANVEYRLADLATAELGDADWDLVHSSLALHYVDDLHGVAVRVARSLRPGGRTVLTSEHPIFSARAPGWVRDEEGGLAYRIADYQVEDVRVTEWLGHDVAKHHRTLGTQLMALINAGLRLEHVEEWCPSDEQIEAEPELARERHRAQILIVAATRTDP